MAKERSLVLHRHRRSKAAMNIGDLLKHTASGEFVVVMDLSHSGKALVCFTTGALVGQKQWHSIDVGSERL